MKKYLAISMACVALSTAAIAAPATLAQVNAEIKGLLSGFQNSRTKASLTFKDLRTNGKQALGLAVTALYKKSGNNELIIKLDNLSYKYGTRPITSGSGSVKVDFTRLMAREDLNQLIPNIETMVNGLANTFAAKYGQAGNLVAKVSDLKKDEAGNYESLKAEVTFKLNYASLPASVAKDDVMFDSGRVSFSMSATQGFTFNFELVSNRDYKGFKDSEKGLKEYIDQLLSKDPRTMDEIKSMFRQLDEGAEGIAEGKLPL